MAVLGSNATESQKLFSFEIVQARVQTQKKSYTGQNRGTVDNLIREGGQLRQDKSIHLQKSRFKSVCMSLKGVAQRRVPEVGNMGIGLGSNAIFQIDSGSYFSLIQFS